MAFEPILLKYVGAAGSGSLDFYLGHGGYEGARKALTQFQPAQLIEEVKRSGLRGRGGAGFPTGTKWSFVPATDKPKYLVVNADESEPGTFKDRALIESDPHLILDGLIIAAYAIGCRHAYIYIRGEMGAGARVLQRAIDEAYAHGCFGKGIFKTAYDLDVTLHRGAGAYICGEETGLLSSLEGDRGYPKIKPPFPAVQGLFRCPTIVNNVETVCNLPFILTRGVAWFRSMGTDKSPGAKIFCVCGHVKKPGNVEVPLGTPLKTLIYEHAGGVLGDRKLKAVIPGGSSAPILTADEIDVAMDFDSLAARGSMLGSGGVIVIDETTCMVDALLNLARFYHHESCGQCTPCREGCGWIEKMLRRIERGEGRMEDIDLCLEVAKNMCGRTICVLADALALPVGSFIPKFRSEFEQHVKERRCPMKSAVTSPSREAASAVSAH